MAPFCHRVEGVIRASTTVHIGTGWKTGVIKHSRAYISGAAIRGAVGTALMKIVCKRDAPLRDHEKCEYFNDCCYVKLFGEEFGKPSRIFFRYAYPVHIGCGGVFRPVPKTIHRCSNPQCRRVYDSFTPRESCEACGESVKPAGGFRCDKCGLIERSPVRMTRVTLTAVDRQTNAAAQIPAKNEAAGTLHTLEVISSGSRFAFEAVVFSKEEPELDLIRNVVERALPDEGIGGSKSRGLGKVAVEGIKVHPVDLPALEKRAEAIDLGDFTVDLLSPMLLDGKALDPPSLLEGARRAYTMAAKTGKPALPEVRLVAKSIDGEVFSGWSLRHEKMRRPEPAVSAGSVFRFASTGDSKELALGLAALECYAIGSYKPHGCGQIRVRGKGV